MVVAAGGVIFSYELVDLWKEFYDISSAFYIRQTWRNKQTPPPWLPLFPKMSKRARDNSGNARVKEPPQHAPTHQWENDTHVFSAYDHNNTIVALDKRSGETETLLGFADFAVAKNKSITKMLEISERRSTGKDPLERIVCGIDMDDYDDE